MQEITGPLAGLPDDPMPDVANVEFQIVLRGYDRVAVDAYVRRVSKLVADLDAGRSPQAAVRRALERVGDEVAGILQRAHETADQITTSSRAEAEDRIEAARQEAQAIMADAREQAQTTVAGAQHLLTELDAETDRIWAERHQIVEDARSLATQLIGLAEAAVERFPATDEHQVSPAAEDQTDEHHLGAAADEHPADYVGQIEGLELEEHELEAGEGDTGELAEPPGPHTEPFDIESQAPLPGEEPTTQHTLPLQPVKPPEDDDGGLSHDAE
jgi:cell division initiation protein